MRGLSVKEASSRAAKMYTKNGLALIIFWFSLFLFSTPVRGNGGVPVEEQWSINNFCFRRLNDTHQFGCTSELTGNVGVVHWIFTPHDFEYVISEGPDTKYVPVITDIELSAKSLEEFATSGRVAGVLVTQSGTTPKAYSTDDTCPNRYTSGYKGPQSCQYNNLTDNKVSESSLRHYPFPIFYTGNTSIIEKVRQCFNEFNAKTMDLSPFQTRKCSLKLFSPMNAVVDTRLCMRRSSLVTYFTLPTKFCDPLEGQNIFSLISASKPTNETVLIVARADAFSQFDGIAPGADAAVSNIVTMISAAKTLTTLKNSSPLVQNRHILFALFNGEAFDYIGSSRFVDDLQKEAFKYNISLENIVSVIELNQLFLDKNANWYAHVDAAQYNNVNIRSQIDTIVKGFSSSRIKLSQDLDLPPASVRMFLRAVPQLPSVVITNHEKTFTNHFYNSIFDSLGHRIVDLDPQVDNLQALVQSVVRSILTISLADPKTTPSTIDVDKTFIGGLLDCYLKNATCDTFRTVVNPDVLGLLREQPYPLYVSVTPGPGYISPITVLTYLTLGYVTGTVVPNATDDQACLRLQKENPTWSFNWINGDNPSKEQPGICIRHLSSMMSARSPAFDDDLPEEKRAQYSTWTESVWSQPSMSLFVQASGVSELTAVILGSVTLVLSIIFVVLIRRRVDDLFDFPTTDPQTSPVAC